MGKNRSMEQKRIKYLKQSKARPRTLRMNKGYQKTAQSVDRSKIPEEHIALFAYRERGNSFVEDYLAAKYPSHNQVSIQRVTALAAISTIEKETNVVTVIQAGKVLSVDFIHDTRLTSFYFVEHHIRLKMIRRSITYNNRDRAMQAYMSGTLRWKDSELLA